jgi:DNA-binding XRE family transcriptional regulator
MSLPMTDAFPEPPITGDQVRTSRERLGWSQAQLAEKAGTNQQTIQRIEAGKTRHSRALQSILRVFMSHENELTLGPSYRKPSVAISEAEHTKDISSYIKDIRRGSASHDDGVSIFLTLWTETGKMQMVTRPIDVVPRSSRFFGSQKTFAIYVSDTVMSPEFQPGDYALVDPIAPPIPDVSCLFLSGPGQGWRPDTEEWAELISDQALCIRRLMRATVEAWETEQWNPAETGSLSRTEWPVCLRIIGKISRP